MFNIDPTWSPGEVELLGMERIREAEGTICPPPDDLYRLSIASRAVAYRGERIANTLDAYA